MPTLLVIDDETAIHGVFQHLFEGTPVTVQTASSAAAGLALFAAQTPDVVFLDVGLPDESGLETFRKLHALDPRVPAILITGAGTTATAIEAMSRGAYEYLLKPLDLAQVRNLVAQALEVSRLMRVPAVVAEDASTGSAGEALLGRCPAMHEVYKAIGRVAPQDVTVLILGESGTGKELVARAVYHYSRRAAEPFLAINCAAIPEALLESELFGHEKGAFTGAGQRRIGKFEQCAGGTLFLDEIGDMAPLTQTKILRALQEQQVERVGSNETIQTDVRLIAATNRNLDQLVAAGRFRQDLYYRLNVYTITLPPLRERGDDLSLLMHQYVQRYRRELGKDVHSVAEEALELLRRYPWPGNVRELQSVLKYAMLQATGPVLVPEFLPSSVRGFEKTRPPEPAAEVSSWAELDRFIEQRLQAGTQDLYQEWTALLDRHLFKAVRRHTRDNVSQAAKILGIHRNTLRTRMLALGLLTEKAPDAPSDSAG